ncbi:MAG TPA: MFS transporter [Acidimicrobiales bacterium]|nr:MFS transporter [Acidimicrobiales bacterium]
MPEDAIALVEPAGDDPGKDRRLVFLVLAIALFMASIDSTIIASALPKIGSGLHAQLNWTSWTITIFQLGALVALPVGGKIADQFGRRQIFLAALTIFTVSSLLCGLSTSIYMLIPLRLVQALGAGSLMPSAIGIAAESFGRNRDRAIGMFTSVYPFGGLIGSAIGGPIAVYFGWRAIFFINVPIGLGVYVLAVRHLPITPRRDSNPLDVFGVALLALTIVAGMIAITLMGEANASVLNPGFVAALACALGFGHQFWRHEKRTPTPFIPLRLIVGEGFARLNIINVLYGSVLIGFGSLIPLYAHQRYGIGLSAAGSVLSARAIGAVVVAAASTMMLRRTGVRLPMIVGFALVLVGGVALGIAPRGMAPYWWLALFAGVTGLGMGMATPASNNASLHLAPDAIAAISGIRGMFRQIGGITYVSIVTTILARSANNAAAGIAQAHAFWVEGGVLIVLIVLVLRVPDHKGTW